MRGSALPRALSSRGLEAYDKAWAGVGGTVTSKQPGVLVLCGWEACQERLQALELLLGGQYASSPCYAAGI